MGTLNKGKCKECGHKFEYSLVGGFNFAIINCNKCHRARSVSWDDKKKSTTHGPCECGGTFTNDAKVRCPECNSDRVKDLGVKLYFD